MVKYHNSVDDFKENLKANFDTLTDAIDNDLQDVIDDAYQEGYDDGLEEGEIIQILRQSKPNFDPWCEEGEKDRDELRAIRAKQYKAEARKARREAKAKEKLVSSVQLNKEEKQA